MYDEIMKGQIKYGWLGHSKQTRHNVDIVVLTLTHTNTLTHVYIHKANTHTNHIHLIGTFGKASKRDETPKWSGK